MAKGLRSSARKCNKAKLRATLFGPLMDARTERLSIKLQEISSKQLSRDANMSGNQNEVQICDTKSGNDMDNAKRGSGVTRPSDVNPIQKRTRRKKRSSIVFAQHPEKARRIRQKSWGLFYMPLYYSYSCLVWNSWALSRLISVSIGSETATRFKADQNMVSGEYLRQSYTILSQCFFIEREGSRWEGPPFSSCYLRVCGAVWRLLRESPYFVYTRIVVKSLGRTATITRNYPTPLNDPSYFN